MSLSWRFSKHLRLSSPKLIFIYNLLSSSSQTVGPDSSIQVLKPEILSQLILPFPSPGTTATPWSSHHHALLAAPAFFLALPSIIFSPCISQLLLFSHSVQLFVTLWTCSLPSSTVHGILQARILEWVAISFSSASSLLKTYEIMTFLFLKPSPPPPPSPPHQWLPNTFGIIVCFYLTS